MKKELLRQLIHASGVFIVVLSYFLKPDALIIISIAVLVFVEILFQIDKKFNIFFFSFIFRRCARQNDERGFIYFFIGIILTLIIFQFNMSIANAAILILLFGDSASTIIGRKWGKHKIPFQKEKTVEGSLAFFLVGLVVALTQVPFLPAFLGVISGALTEAYSPIDDNIPIPLICALIMSLTVYLI
ncbi:MAG: SEC59/DGK1/VTE5 family protein [Methanobacterium sp.]|nr:SEC59/DGK1/VTE5 family protein [Methanobacterium sp.]